MYNTISVFLTVYVTLPLSRCLQSEMIFYSKQQLVYRLCFIECEVAYSVAKYCLISVSVLCSEKHVVEWLKLQEN